MKLSWGTLVPALVIALASSSAMAAENSRSKTTSQVTRGGGIEVIEENVAAALVVRISRVELSGNFLRLSDLKGQNRISIYPEGYELMSKYYNSRGMAVGEFVTRRIDRATYNSLRKMTESTHAGCPLDVTIDRSSLAIIGVKAPFCEDGPVKNFTIVSVSKKGNQLALNANSGAAILVLENNNYSTIERQEWVSLYPEVAKAISRASLGVSSQCPMEISLDSNGRLKKIKTTCDSLAQAPYQDTMG